MGLKSFLTEDVDISWSSFLDLLRDEGVLGKGAKRAYVTVDDKVINVTLSLSIEEAKQLASKKVRAAGAATGKYEVTLSKHGMHFRKVT